MIVVAIDSTKRVRDFTQSDWPAGWIGGGGAANFRRFLATELIPAIDRAYRTDGFRVLSGHSAGGQFALYCLTVEPALFQRVHRVESEPGLGRQPPAAIARRVLRSDSRAGSRFVYVARSDDSGRALADYERLVGDAREAEPRRDCGGRARPTRTRRTRACRCSRRSTGCGACTRATGLHDDMLEKGIRLRAGALSGRVEDGGMGPRGAGRCPSTASGMPPSSRGGRRRPSRCSGATSRPTRTPPMPGQPGGRLCEGRNVEGGCWRPRPEPRSWPRSRRIRTAPTSRSRRGRWRRELKEAPPWRP